MKQSFITSLLHVYLCFYILLAVFSGPGIEPASSANRSLFFETHPQRIPKIGSYLEPLAKVLPAKGAVSFLFEKPYQELDANTKEVLMTAQAYLCPLVLDPEPGQNIGFMVGSNREDTEARLKSSGYAWIMRTASGKGLIKKVK